MAGSEREEEGKVENENSINGIELNVCHSTMKRLHCDNFSFCPTVKKVSLHADLQQQPVF